VTIANWSSIKAPATGTALIGMAMEISRAWEEYSVVYNFLCEFLRVEKKVLLL